MGIPLRVLLLEDSEMDAELLLRTLRRENYDVTYRRVDTAAGMRAALHEETWDIVVSDHSMPSFDVLAALELLREFDIDIPFILVSGSIGDEVAAGAMKAGAHDFFLKNRLARLGAAVQRELGEAQVRRERRLATARLAENERLLRRAVQVRDDFLTIASHELKTPLTPLLLQLASAVKLLQTSRDAGAEVPVEHLAERLRKAVAHVERLKTLVDRLLDVTRISSGHLPLAPQPVDLREVIGALVDRLAEGLERSGSRVTLTADSVIGVWDATGIETVVTNLLTNAVKYGEGRPVEVTVTRSDRDATISVNDHGIGIAPEDQERIFERFERAVPLQHYGGFGIGLWVAKRVVEAHGGTISVSSAPGKGSTFVVTLPITPAAPPSGPASGI
jgi:signal transduction histidine kinase